METMLDFYRVKSLERKNDEAMYSIQADETKERAMKCEGKERANLFNNVNLLRMKSISAGVDAENYAKAEKAIRGRRDL